MAERKSFDIELLNKTKSKRKFASSKRIIKEKITRTPFEVKIAHALYHNYTQALLALILVISLFLPDGWVIVNPSNNLDVFYNLSLIICVIVFSIEIVLLCIVQVDYFNSTFFWMDIVGTVSCIFDLTFVTDIITNSGSADTRALRAARVAKIGAKAGRLSRITKFLKFIHFNSNTNDDEDIGKPVENISAKLSLVLSQRVALLVMILVVVSPLISNSVTDYSGSAHLINIDEIANYNAFNAQEWGHSISNFKEFYDTLRKSKDNLINDPVWLKVRGISPHRCPSNETFQEFEVSWVDTSVNNDDAVNDDDVIDDDDGFNGYCRYDFNQHRPLVNNNILRQQNKHFANTRGHGKYAHRALCNPQIEEFAFICSELENVDVLFDNTEGAVLEAWASFGLICVIIFLLVAFTAAFKYAVDDLIVQPISRMMIHIHSSIDENVLNSVIDILDDDGEDQSSRSEVIVLEKLVQKLTKIVQSSLSNKKKELLKEGIDQDTKDWLTQDYVLENTSNDKEEEDVSLIPARYIRRPPSVSHLSMDLDLNIPINIVNSFDLDILSLTEFQLTPLIVYMFERYSIPRHFQINSEILENFINKIKDGYLKTPHYHNFYHGVDVMHTVYRFLDMTHADEYCNKLEFFAALVAALAHDLGHLGVNNTFLVKTKHDLALLHNDVAPLENMHASKLYDILRDPTCNIMLNLDDIQWQTARNQILSSILNTDMALHFDNLKKFEVFSEVNGNYVNDFLVNIESGTYPVPDCLKDSSNKLLLHEVILHAADLGNPVMPTCIGVKWVQRICDEFFSQGDEELKLGMPISAMFNRETTNIPNMQLGFIEFVVSPLYLILFSIYQNNLSVLAENLESNFVYYARQRELEAPDEKIKLSSRVMKLRQKLQETGLNISFPEDDYTTGVHVMKQKQLSNISGTPHRNASSIGDMSTVLLDAKNRSPMRGSGGNLISGKATRPNSTSPKKSNSLTSLSPRNVSFLSSTPTANLKQGGESVHSTGGASSSLPSKPASDVAIKNTTCEEKKLPVKGYIAVPSPDSSVDGETKDIAEASQIVPPSSSSSSSSSSSVATSSLPSVTTSSASSITSSSSSTTISLSNTSPPGTTTKTSLSSNHKPSPTFKSNSVRTTVTNTSGSRVKQPPVSLVSSNHVHTDLEENKSKSLRSSNSSKSSTATSRGRAKSNSGEISPPKQRGNSSPQPKRKGTKMALASTSSKKEHIVDV